MTSTPASSFQRRRLREALRRIREQAQLTQEQAAQSMEWSQSKLIRIELGSVGITVTDLRALLELYRVRDKALVDELVALARTSRKRSWLAPYKNILAPGFYTYAELEPDASALRMFQTTVIPGILQTRTYAAAVLTESAPPVEVSRERIELLVELRMRRQRKVFEQPEPPMLLIVLDEAALRRTVGDRSVTREQLLHVVGMADDLDQVHIVVLPFSTGAHPGLQGSFILADFAEDVARPILYQEGTSSYQLIRNKNDVIETYRLTFDHMVKRGLSEAESLAFIRQVADEMK